MSDHEATPFADPAPTTLSEEELRQALAQPVAGEQEQSSRHVALPSESAPGVGATSREDSLPGVLADVLAVFDELLLLPDHSPILVALAGVVANLADGDPVWPLLVGPPGCGKSEIVTALAGAPNVWQLSSLTPNTLLSGAETSSGAPASLLLQIGEFGILAFKDLTTVLTMHRESRQAIIGQLREVADGRCAKSFGTGARVEWKGKIGLIAGVTPVIDEQHAFLATMGERFLLFRMPEVDRREMARRSLAQRGSEGDLRQKIKDKVGGFLGGFEKSGPLPLPENFTEPLITLTDIVTRARTGVARDGWSRDLLYLPDPEAPTRLAKQLAQLAAALLAIGVDTDEAWRIVRKGGWDSVPAVRRSVIEWLAIQAESTTVTEIQEATGVPGATARRVADDLVALRLARKTKGSANTWRYEQTKILREYAAEDRPPA